MRRDITSQHTFHIPVMGIGFTVDTPLRIAKYGINSTISLVDDILMEKLRQYYCEKFHIQFSPIHRNEEDARAKRITAYLNLVNKLTINSFEELKKYGLSEGSDLKRYVDLLPHSSKIKKTFESYFSSGKKEEGVNWLKENLKMGEIEVNIMTKLDKTNYSNGSKLPGEFNDAHAALRGFANSNLNSSIVLSAGMHPRLYSYMENFEDFYPNAEFKFKKKIVLKVSDYRSAAIQSRFLTKKGLWISEYRIESALNCGGHAFATQGYLLGPILEEFCNNWDSLIESNYNTFTKALQQKNKPVPPSVPNVKFTAQGGVGTHEEHQFLLNKYNVDSVGWGTPFLLVKEVTNVDDYTRNLLAKAGTEDLYLSSISPLGVPFNTLRSNTKDIEKEHNIELGKPGSLCTKGYGKFNNEFGEKGICTGSREYQALKIRALNEKNLDAETYKKEYRKIVEKSCICVGLGTSALLVKNIEPDPGEGKGVSVCSGPNMAYFNQITSLDRMVDHIYGKQTLKIREDRPNVFIKEIEIYLDFLKNELREAAKPLTKKQEEYFKTFHQNIINGIEYYKQLFSGTQNFFRSISHVLLQNLNILEKEFIKIKI